MIRPRLVRVTLLASLVLALFGASAPAAAQTGTTFFITDVISSQFPTISFRLRAVDLSNQVVAGRNNTNLTVYENGNAVPAANVTVTPHDDGPIVFLFLVDQGQLSNFEAFGVNNIRLVFSRLMDSGIFVNDRDTVEVMVRENINSDRTEARLGPTQLGGDLATWLASYPFERRSTSRTKGLEGVADAIGEMGRLITIPGSQTGVILLLTRYVETPATTVAISAAQNQANDAKSKYILIYSFQTDLSQTNRQPLESLSVISNGEYVPLSRNGVAASVDRVYEALNAQRLYYTVTYQSESGESGSRTITVNSPERPAAGVTGSYNAAPQPPVVALEEPAANTVIEREALRQSDGTPVYDPAKVKVTATVSFPDGFPRSLQSGELLIDGALADTAKLQPDSSQVEFEADLSNVTTPGSNKVVLEVKVVDSLGLEASAQTTVSVDVKAPAALPLNSTTLLVICGVLAACGVGAILLAGAVGATSFFARRRSAAPAAAVARPAPAEAQPTVVVGRIKGVVLATLTVLEGPKGLIGETVRIIKPTTLIGRNRKATDISFYADEESSVSRIHCTIQKDGSVFKLTDNGSSSGTRLNGRTIQPNDPVVLADNDEIVLGELAQRGVKVRFNTVTDQGELKYTGSADDRTQIIDEPPGGDNFDKYTD